MNIITSLLNIFSSKEKNKTYIHGNDIRFSTLIRHIQKDLVEANKSLEFVGLKYIEHFFEKEPPVYDTELIDSKIKEISEKLDDKDNQKAKNLLQELKNNINETRSRDESSHCQYRPKMSKFDIPVYKNGDWTVETMKVPLLALSPISIPKIKEVKIRSKMQNIKHDGNHVYVRIMQEKSSKLKKRHKNLAEQSAELTIAITPQQSQEELNHIIHHYEQLLCSN